MGAAFVQLEKIQELNLYRMLQGNGFRAVKHLKARFLSWKHSRDPNDKLHCSEGMEVTDTKGAFKIACKIVKVESICAEAGIREHSITISDVKRSSLAMMRNLRLDADFHLKYHAHV